jgi:hypothetical protein
MSDPLLRGEPAPQPLSTLGGGTEIEHIAGLEGVGVDRRQGLPRPRMPHHDIGILREDFRQQAPVVMFGDNELIDVHHAVAT